MRSTVPAFGSWRPARRGGLLLAGLLAALHARGVTATSLASFDGIEEPLVRYAPASGAFTPDPLLNITAETEGVFRMYLRYRPDVWDADRDTLNTDRQRAEVKGLGPHQKPGDTFQYETTWRTDPEFRAVARFCHVFQLKSTDGDSGAPLVTISIEPGAGLAAVKYWSGGARHATDAVTFPWKPGVWQTVRLRIMVSPDHGELLASVDGGAFHGVRGIPLFRPGASDYRPKWGLYRGVRAGLELGDDYVEHRGLRAQKVGDPSFAPDLELAATRQAAAAGPAAALAWLRARPAGPARDQAVASIVAGWANQDPLAALSAAATLDPAEGRADALLRGFAHWTDLDPGAALDWARNHSPPGELDRALWYYTTDTTLRYRRRELALAGAAQIAAGDLRTAAVEHIVLIWARREPEAAARYAQLCPALSPAARSALARRILAARRPAPPHVRSS